jgi:hypothetical protein
MQRPSATSPSPHPLNRHLCVSLRRRHGMFSKSRAQNSKTASASRQNTSSPQPSAQSDVFFPPPLSTSSSIDNASQAKQLPPAITTPKRLDSIPTRQDYFARDPESPTHPHIKLDGSRDEHPQPLQVQSNRSKSPISTHGRSATAGPEYNGSREPEQEASVSRPYESSPQLADKTSLSAPASNTGFPSNVNVAPAATKRHSLMAPAKDKASNRRSGFYGAPMLPPTRLDPPGSPLREDDETEDASMPIVQEAIVRDDPLLPTPPLSPGIASSPSTPSATQEHMRTMTPPPKNPLPMHVNSALSVPTSPDGPDISRSLSFYDPDMLAFISYSPTRPDSKTLDVPRTPQVDGSPLLPSDSPQLDGMQNEDGFASPDDTEDQTAKLEEADTLGSIKKLRESLKPVSGGEAMIADVTLIDTLISELEDTKSRMKTLQREFNAMKVRGAFGKAKPFLMASAYSGLVANS